MKIDCILNHHQQTENLIRKTTIYKTTTNTLSRINSSDRYAITLQVKIWNIIKRHKIRELYEETEYVTARKT